MAKKPKAVARTLESLLETISKRGSKVDVPVDTESADTPLKVIPSTTSLNIDTYSDAQQLLLPISEDAFRSIPNATLRSAIFGAFTPTLSRNKLDKVKIHSQEGIEITYSGEALDQEDMNTWINVVHACKGTPPGRPFSISAYRLLKMMGKTDTGGNRKTLHQRIDRLQFTQVRVVTRDITFTGSFIDNFYNDNETKGYLITLSPQIVRLFGSSQYTLLEWKVRQMLAGKHLAQWLHGYYSSHARAYPTKVETLYKMSGSKATSLNSFRQGLFRALNAVKEASEANKKVFDWKYEDGLISVEKSISDSQSKHLNRMKTGRKKTKISE